MGGAGVGQRRLKRMPGASWAGDSVVLMLRCGTGVKQVALGKGLDRRFILTELAERWEL